MKLYQSNSSPFAARVRLAIYIKGLDVEIPEPQELRKSVQRLPAEKIPTLELDDGTLIPESEVICEFLEDVYPDPPAYPAKPKNRMRARVLTRWLDLGLVPAMTPLGPAAMGKEVAQSDVDKAIGEMNLWLGRIEDWIDANPYAIGDRLSYADGALLPFLVSLPLSCELLGIPEPIAGRPKLRGYLKAVTDANAHAKRLVEEVDEAGKKSLEMMGKINKLHAGGLLRAYVSFWQWRQRMRGLR